MFTTKDQLLHLNNTNKEQHFSVSPSHGNFVKKHRMLCNFKFNDIKYYLSYNANTEETQQLTKTNMKIVGQPDMVVEVLGRIRLNGCHFLSTKTCRLNLKTLNSSPLSDLNVMKYCNDEIGRKITVLYLTLLQYFSLVILTDQNICLTTSKNKLLPRSLVTSNN